MKKLTTALARLLRVKRHTPKPNITGPCHDKHELAGTARRAAEEALAYGIREKYLPANAYLSTICIHEDFVHGTVSSGDQFIIHIEKAIDKVALH